MPSNPLFPWIDNMKLGRQASLSAHTPTFKSREVTKSPTKSSKIDYKKSASPTRLRSVSPMLGVRKVTESTEATELPKKRDDMQRIRTSHSSVRRNLGDLGKADLRRGNFSKKQIVATVSLSLNVSVVDLSPEKTECRSPSPIATRSNRCQQLSKGFKITKTGLMQSVGSVSQRLLRSTPTPSLPKTIV